MIFQRPESQVLGVRARDDVVWGLPPTPRPDVGALLARVGLAGFEERETAGLSGGELQRLAIAACLAREPRLLISDEATAMIDGPGRAEVVALLESLAAAGITVVHVTHREAEAAKAGTAILMLAGAWYFAAMRPGAPPPARARSRGVKRPRPWARDQPCPSGPQAQQSSLRVRDWATCMQTARRGPVARWKMSISISTG